MTALPRVSVAAFTHGESADTRHPARNTQHAGPDSAAGSGSQRSAGSWSGYGSEDSYGRFDSQDSQADRGYEWNARRQRTHDDRPKEESMRFGQRNHLEPWGRKSPSIASLIDSDDSICPKAYIIRSPLYHGQRDVGGGCRVSCGGRIGVVLPSHE